MARARFLPAVAALLAAGACAGGTPRPSAPADGTAPSAIRVQLEQRGRRVVRTVSLEDYVPAAALSEFAPAGGEAELVGRMLELQTIISRTFAIANVGRHAAAGFDLCASSHCQVYEPERLRTSRWGDLGKDAARRTRGRWLRHGGSAALSLYHADCGGHTSSASAVWGGPGPAYLRARADDGPASPVHVGWKHVVSGPLLRRSLNADHRTRVGVRVHAIEVMERDEAGRAATVRIKGDRLVVVRGDVLREVLTRSLGARAIRSTLFDVRRRGGNFEFSGRGFGHGVGLCQAGALARLRAGQSVADVLQFYFPGTILN